MRIVLAGTGVLPVPPVGYGGVERTLAEYARSLEAAGHSVTVVQQIRSGRPRDEYFFAWNLPRLLSKLRYDVIHASTPVVANRLALAGVRFVYTSHSRHWFESERVTERFGFWLERRAVRRAFATVALTDRVRQKMVEKMGPSISPQLLTIPIGVDLSAYRANWPERTGRVALGVGVIRPVKRWELAAEALRGTGIALRLVGPVHDRAYADRVLSSGDSVRLLGELSDEEVRREYSTSDFLIHPSRVELLAGVVLQALAAELPVLGAESVAGLVGEGSTGWTAPSDATPGEIVEFFRDRAGTLVSDGGLRERMGAAARRSAEARFSWPTVVDQHLQLYERFLDSGATSRA